MNLFEKIKKKILTSFIISAYKDIGGWLTENEAFGLYVTAGRVPEGGLVVEIGSWKGKSTYCLAKGLKGGKIFAIDPFDASGEEESVPVYAEQKGEISLLEQFRKNMQSCGVLSKIEIKEGFSNKFKDEFAKIDFLFIDGDHSIEGCDYDFVNFSPKVVKGGYIAFHDFYQDRDELGPTWVVKNRILNANEFRFVKLYDSLWIGQKI